MDIPAALLAAFPPSSQLLLDIARRQIDDEMLAEIAAADHGIDSDSHLAALRLIRDTGVVPKSMEWHPGEVLELIRYSNPEDPNHKPGSTGRRGHQMRAFACAVLLRAAADGGDKSSEEATLAQCLSSAKVLGEEMNAAAARFLTWRIPMIRRIPTMTCPDEWLFALGLLVVTTRFANHRVTDRVLGDAASWFLDTEPEFRLEFPTGFEPANPRPAAFGLTCGLWKPLITELIENAARIQSTDVRNDLEMIGRTLQEES